MRFYTFTLCILYLFNALVLCRGGPEGKTAWQVNALKTIFSKARNHEVNNNGKQAARAFIINHFKTLGLTVLTQDFKTERKDVTGQNIIGILKGKNYGTSGDTYYGIAAHYDTMPQTPGVNDNGSGVVAMLEAARILKEAGKLSQTLVFIAFDFEEAYNEKGTACSTVSCGSTYFISHWPKEMQNSLPKSKFGGVIVADTVMNYENSTNNQRVPLGFNKAFPNLYNRLTKSGFKGNFLLITARQIDMNISAPFIAAWGELDNKALEVAEISLKIGNPPSTAERIRYSDFLRSDHSVFWSYSLPAICISDTADLRGFMKQCYHKSCDDTTNLDEDNILLLEKVTNALVQTMLKLSPKISTSAGSIISTSFAVFAVASLLSVWQEKFYG